jgi:hypothetical protein
VEAERSVTVRVVKRKMECLLLCDLTKSWQLFVRNNFTTKTVSCGNRNCVVGLGDQMFKVRDSRNGVFRE